MRIEDQLGRDLQFAKPPTRVISLVPSLSELHAYCYKGSLIGKTKFCIAPDSIHSLATIGGTKNPNLEKINQLNPDLILANKEENRLDDIRTLEKKFPVYVSDVNCLDDLYEVLIDLDSIMQSDAGKQLKKDLQQVFIVNDNGLKKPRVLYFIWKKPWMIAGKGTFIDCMLAKAGFVNLGADIGERYPSIEREDVLNLNADLLLFSTEPYPFEKENMHDLKSFFKCPNKIVDGTYFSWYSNRLLKAPVYFQTLRDKMF